MSTIRYLLDENLPGLYRTQLSRRDASIVVAGVGTPGAPPNGTLDPEILVYCELNSLILVTNNRHSMPVHLRDHLAQGRHVPGIFVMNPGMSVGETIEELLLIWRASNEEEYHDRLFFLPISS